MRENISDLLHKIKLFLSGDFFIVLFILLIGLTSFGLGRLSVLSQDGNGVKIEYPDGVILNDISNKGQVASPRQDSTAENTTFVASKNGTRYHFPWCSGAQRIKEENKISFESREDAEKAGYTPAQNCKGL